MMINNIYRFMQSPPFLPQAYWDAVSNEQRIKHLFTWLHKVTEYIDELSNLLNELGDDFEQLRKDFDALNNELHELFEKFENEEKERVDLQIKQLEEELKNLINELEKSPGWNVEKGEVTSAKNGFRILRSELPFNLKNINKRPKKMLFTQLCEKHNITVEDLKNVNINFDTAKDLKKDDFQELEKNLKRKATVFDLSTRSSVVVSNLNILKNQNAQAGYIRAYAWILENWITAGKCYVSDIYEYSDSQNEQQFERVYKSLS